MRAAERRAEAIAAACCAAALLVGLWWAAGFFHDDAYITMRYVDRWLAGHGLGWNAGERVEGFTHPAWLLQLTGLGALGVDLRGAARGLGVVYLVALLGAWRVLRLPASVGLLLAAQPGLWAWAWGGLETVAFCFWLLAALVVSARAERAAIAGLLFFVAAMHRPEALGLAALCAAWTAWQGRTPAALRLFAATVLPFAVFLALRWWWFGDLLPNSARAKLGGVPAWLTWQMGASYLAWNWAAWLPAAIVALGFALRDPRGSWRIELCGVALLVAVVLSGGDHMPFGRFALPAGAVFALAAAMRARAEGAAGWGGAALIGAAVLTQVAAGFGPRPGLDPAARDGAVVGRYLEQHLPAGASVALATAGSTPYYAPSLRFIDTLGLNDRVIALRDPVPVHTHWQRMPGHRKGDGAYVLERAPDLVILGPALGFDGRPARRWFLTDFELSRSAEFHERYAAYRFEIEANSPLIAWLRRDSPAADALAGEGEALPRTRPAD